MLLTETILVALSALRGNKLRSVLTMLGVVIGVGSVIRWSHSAPAPSAP
jgi:putative ABC transport system permease protein